jgi:hypothetical protein
MRRKGSVPEVCPEQNGDLSSYNRIDEMLDEREGV